MDALWFACEAKHRDGVIYRLGSGSNEIETAAESTNWPVECYLPHGPILRRAALVISHGGMGTTQKALAAGVPVCVVPFMRDQFEVARRVEHCGAGTLLASKRLRPDRLRAAVERALECRAGAQRVRDGFQRAGGAEGAAAALEGLTAGERRRVSA